MRLLLVQHGDALPKEMNPDRPLSPRGRSDVERLATFLDRAGVRVARILHSGKLRAAQTADTLAARLLPETTPAATTGLSPNDPVDPIAAQAATWTDDTALVGHLPFMARLAAKLLAGDKSATTVTFLPGTVVCLERTETNQWTLTWMIRPELLAD